MAVCLVIPARYRSRRLPGKALSGIGTRPLLAHVWESVRRGTDAARVVVATDDHRIARCLGRAGAEVMMTSAEHRNGTGRVAEVARSIDAETFVNLQGDELYVTTGMIDAVLKTLANGPFDVATIASRVPRNDRSFVSPHAVKVVRAADGRALYFSRTPIPYEGTSWLRHIGIYAYGRETLARLAATPPTPLERAEGLEQLRALECGMTIGVAVTRETTLAVNSVDDLQRARAAEAARTGPARRRKN